MPIIAAETIISFIEMVLHVSYLIYYTLGGRREKVINQLDLIVIVIHQKIIPTKIVWFGA